MQQHTWPEVAFKVHNDSMGSITFWMRAVPPFRLDLTVWALRRRSVNQVDRWDGKTYRRVLVVGRTPAEVEVVQLGSSEAPRLGVTVTGSRVTPRMKSPIRASVERLLGTRVDLTQLYRMATQQPRLGDLVRRFRGFKPPRFPSVFESLLNAISCQQVSLEVGLLLLNRLTKRYGLPMRLRGEEVHAFPQPCDLADERLEALRTLGFSRQKTRAIIELSREVATRRLDLEQFKALEGDALQQRLMSFRGVGRWSAEYVSLRGLGKLDTFPGDDVGAQNKLKRYLRLRNQPSYKSVRRQLMRWGPYAGMIYFHLLLQGLAEKGYLD